MRGFAASGGGSRGQFHVGVLDYLLGEQAVDYQAFAGVSVGALVCAFLAQYPSGQEGVALYDLKAMFSSVTTEDIWKRWFPFGKLHGLWKSSLLDSSPLQQLVRQRLDPDKLHTSGKELFVGAVSLASGRYTQFSHRYEHIVDAVLASASYPAFFKPVQVSKLGLFTDGGVRQVTPIKALIDAGCTRIDVSICHPKNARESFADRPTSVDVALRALELMGDEIIWADVARALMYNELVRLGGAPGKRYVDIRVIYPTRVLNKDPLHFSPQEAKVIQQAGYLAAKTLFQQEKAK